MWDTSADGGWARAVDAGASFCLGGAVAVSLALSGADIAAALGGGALTWFAARRALARIGGAPLPFAVLDFTSAPMIAAAPELLLTPDQVVAFSEEADDALLLEDMLAGPADNSRVIRLFDPAALPTAGELQRRVDRHLLRPTSPRAEPDDADALHEALAALRRSLGTA